MVNNLVFWVAKTFIFHGFGGSWYIYIYIWVFPKMVGFPNNPMGFPTKNDQLWGVLGVPPF